MPVEDTPPGELRGIEPMNDLITEDYSDVEVYGQIFPNAKPLVHELFGVSAGGRVNVRPLANMSGDDGFVTWHAGPGFVGEWVWRRSNYQDVEGGSEYRFCGGGIGGMDCDNDSPPIAGQTLTKQAFFNAIRECEIDPITQKAVCFDLD